MKNNILTVMKKELMRFLGDRRILFGAVLLPGIIIYVVYSFMGSAMQDLFSPDKSAANIAAVNMPASISTLFKTQLLPYEEIDPNTDLESKKADVATKNVDILIVFPGDFDALVDAYDIKSGSPAPNIQLYHNGADPNSSELYERINGLLNQYEGTLANKFDVNGSDDKVAAYDLADEKDVSGQIFSSMMPMLLIIFLFSGCMSIAPEAIAGEKERGTLSTLLVTPVRRGELALGKIFAITLIAILSALSSTVGTVLSLPKLMGGAAEHMDVFYTSSDYLLLGLVILATVLLFVSLISILSAFAKSVKEAQTYATPLMVIAIIVGVSGMFGAEAKSFFVYLIPIYNSVQCMSAIFSFEVNSLHVFITLASNVAYCGILAFVLTKMFHSEKVMFSK